MSFFFIIIMKINNREKEVIAKVDKKRTKVKFAIIMLIIIAIIININIFAMASEVIVKTPNENQFLELRGVEVKEVEGQNKQLTMELWTNSIEFERICS